jgi:sigma-E factor negative regulatory protein RseA
MAPTGSVPAANDAVFRWKMVAGVASLFALATLVWQVTVAPASSTGPQLAQLTPPVVTTALRLPCSRPW